MNERSAIRVYTVVAAMLFGAIPAAAQSRVLPTSGPTIGERYFVEGSAGFWSPSAEMEISSESLGIPGDDIDFKRDLGLTDQRFRELHLVLRPSQKHKLRFQYIPIRYEQDAVITRNIVFNGQLYRVGVPVNSVLDWKAYRFGYEYDFISLNRGFGGVILEAKYTNVRAELNSPIAREFAHNEAPVPSIGGIARVYVVPSISITGEFSGIKIPDSIDESFEAHYTDLDIYGTLNFTNNIGAQIGYRKLDVGYLVDEDTGSFKVSGLYFGVVARY